METTIPQGERKASEYQSEIDILRSRWTANGFQFTEASLQRVARANEERRKASLKKQAQAESSDDEESEPEPEPKAQANSQSARDWINDFDIFVSDKPAAEPEVQSEPEAGPSDQDIDDAWQQYDEEKETEAEPGPGPQIDPEPESEAEPEGTQTAAEAVAQAVRAAAVRQRRSRTPSPPRKLPHGSCTGVWIPKEVYEDPRFESFNEMILYLEVNHLDQEDGCTAKNKHFADYLGCSTQTVQDMIHSMTMREIFICIYPSRTTRIIHIAGGRRSFPPHRG
jgi:hypothetical protein